jgi:hypothetical protein
MCGWVEQADTGTDLDRQADRHEPTDPDRPANGSVLTDRRTTTRQSE